MSHSVCGWASFKCNKTSEHGSAFTVSDIQKHLATVVKNRWYMGQRQGHNMNRCYLILWKITESFIKYDLSPLKSPWNHDWWPSDSFSHTDWLNHWRDLKGKQPRHYLIVCFTSGQHILCLHRDWAENIKLSCHLNDDLQSVFKQPDNLSVLC